MKELRLELSGRFAKSYLDHKHNSPASDKKAFLTTERLHRTKRLKRGRFIVCTKCTSIFLFIFSYLIFVIRNFQKIVDLGHSVSG